MGILIEPSNKACDQHAGYAHSTPEANMSAIMQLLGHPYSAEVQRQLISGAGPFTLTAGLVYPCMPYQTPAAHQNKLRSCQISLPTGPAPCRLLRVHHA